MDRTKLTKKNKVQEGSDCCLSSLPNVGKDLSHKLTQCGIHTPEELSAIGTEQAYLRIQAIDPGACFCLLCAIEGAIQGIRWHNLSDGRKEELKQFYDMAKKR